MRREAETSPQHSFRFRKYSVLGNTFIVFNELDGLVVNEAERSDFCRWVLDDEFGVGGADNALFLSRSASGGNCYNFRIFEKDGSETLSCGNGLLAVAALMHDSTSENAWQILTELPSGSPRTIRLGVDRDGVSAWVDMGLPRSMPQELYVGKRSGNLDHVDFIEVLAFDPGAPFSATMGLLDLKGWLVFIGEPHLVLVANCGLPKKVEETIFNCVAASVAGRTQAQILSDNLIDAIGRGINVQYRHIFPAGVHVDFVVASKQRDSIRYRVWERAINQETFACGTGALASVYVCGRLGLLDGTTAAAWPTRGISTLSGAHLSVKQTTSGLLLRGEPQLVYQGTAVKMPAFRTVSPANGGAWRGSAHKKGLVIDDMHDFVPPVKRALEEAGVHVASIDEYQNCDAASFRELVTRQHRPAIFKDLISHWPAVRSWSASTLREQHGHKGVRALVDLPRDGVLMPRDQSQYEVDLSFKDFIELMLSADESAPCYLAYKRADDMFDRSEYNFDELLGAGRKGSDTRVWIGSKGTRSMLHSDVKDNLFCQIWGHKTVTLLPWKDSQAAYPFPDNLVNSRLDLMNLDVGKFAKLRRVTFFSSLVAPGDVVFIPRGCWHDIRAETASISINHWYGESQSLKEYLRLLKLLGPRYWMQTAADFVSHGVLNRKQATTFFFSPPSTGKRLYDTMRWGNFSHENDPSSDG